MRYADKIPYVFILDHLKVEGIVIKPMFGCFGIYSNGCLCMFLMNRVKPMIRRNADPMQNGVYIATMAAHTLELKSIFEKAEIQFLKGEKVWIFVSELLSEFEAYVITVCEMITACDPRIGR
ncbi:MAG: hypothetical protein WBD22_13405 [Pyrinomonadaceae bacterium]